MTSQTHPVGVTQRRLLLLLADTASLRPRSTSRVTGDPLLFDDSSTTRQSVEARAPPFSRVVQRRDTNNRPTAGRHCRTPSDQHKLFLLTERCRQSAPLESATPATFIADVIRRYRSSAAAAAAAVSARTCRTVPTLGNCAVRRSRADCRK